MQIIIKKSNFITIPKNEYLGLLKLRYQVFVLRLQWGLASVNGLESDNYDNVDAAYIYACDDTEKIYGCWRLLPTTGDYMLRTVFLKLLGDQDIPNDPTIIELSRFAVEKQSSTMNGVSSEITMKLFEAIYIHAVNHGIKEYVSVTSTAIERFLKRIKIPCNRIGDQQVHLLGCTKSVVLSMPINDDFKHAVMC
ncbi:acyl-homoserine-lactone synthase [Shewanella hanedai]|uniref:Acyl-homoserine-lactone synthase n=1 Tax=Shewanella hanedai TaxID=25 RepID=A0ZSH0_SHEHA|nr:acyl-homoserine-lactone synthase [Shewanella hanedai]TRY15152.1 GNAT family N-acetyltransferase [Shewanella hanedai]BAF40893.1 hypothetical protein [Shewanella hanedai]GGI74372.1 acyl-homoserine-lactone synthase [Shewanella hanedai]